MQKKTTSLQRVVALLVPALVRFLLWLRYRVQACGSEHIPATGGVLLLGNHLSYLDWAILLITCPRRPHFVLSRLIYRRWHLAPIFKILDHVILISRQGSKEAIHTIQTHLQAGDVIVLFPEGRVSLNGQTGVFHKGYEKAIANTNAVIIPFFMVGLWGALGSSAKSLWRRLQRKSGRRCITIYYGAPLAADISVDRLKQVVITLSIQAWQQFPLCHHSIAWRWLLAAKKMGRCLALTDATDVALSSLRLIVGVRFLQRQFNSRISNQDVVGLILPLSVGGVMANLALFASAKVVVNLNYTAGNVALTHALASAGIKTIITSRQFIQRLQERGFLLDSILTQVSVIYLEDVCQARSQLRLMLDLIYCKLVPFALLSRFMLTPTTPQATAVILFSSGSEGRPKGIELTQQNLVSNAIQVLHSIDLQTQDVLISTLPLFHAFGLTVNMLTPLFAGVPFVCVPDPTDAVTVGKMVYKYQGTLLTSTPTFLNLYCRQRKVHPQMLQSLRLVIGGAEKVYTQARAAFKQKFGLVIYEGYGTTETAPVASVCLPDGIDADDWFVQVANKEGSVGLPLPGTAFRIVDPETLQELPCNQEGLILIGGPQVKRGYWQDPERTANAIVNEGDIRWYKTGDKGRLDEDGFLYIVDRYSRFAKIGGEMVSLTAVEHAVFAVLDDEEAEVLAVAVPDERKGESIILFYVAPIEENDLRKLLIRSGIENIMLPAKLIKLAALPKLGNGKNDYQQGIRMALALNR